MILRTSNIIATNLPFEHFATAIFQPTGLQTFMNAGKRDTAVVRERQLTGRQFRGAKFSKQDSYTEFQKANSACTYPQHPALPVARAC